MSDPKDHTYIDEDNNEYDSFSWGDKSKPSYEDDAYDY